MGPGRRAEWAAGCGGIEGPPRSPPDSEESPGSRQAAGAAVSRARSGWTRRHRRQRLGDGRQDTVSLLPPEHRSALLDAAYERRSSLSPRTCTQLGSTASCRMASPERRSTGCCKRPRRCRRRKLGTPRRLHGRNGGGSHSSDKQSCCPSAWRSAGRRRCPGELSPAPFPSLSLADAASKEESCVGALDAGRKLRALRPSSLRSVARGDRSESGVARHGEETGLERRTRRLRNAR